MRTGVGLVEDNRLVRQDGDLGGGPVQPSGNAAEGVGEIASVVQAYDEFLAGRGKGAGDVRGVADILGAAAEAAGDGGVDLVDFLADRPREDDDRIAEEAVVKARGFGFSVGGVQFSDYWMTGCPFGPMLRC